MERRTFLGAGAGATAALALAAPVAANSAPAVPAGAPSGRDTEALLRRWFRDTYRSLDAMYTDFGLTTDKIDVSGDAPVQSPNTSPTNIGCGLWATVAAARLGVVDGDAMRRRLRRTVAAVERLERAHGFWLNWYDAHTGEVLTEWPETGDPVRPFLSSVDNAWLVTGLRIAADADPALRPRVRALLADADWSFYYTPFDADDPVQHPGQLKGGYWTDDDTYTGHWYGALNTEPRMASYLGIADGTVPGEHYWHVFRTLLPGMGQEQEPAGEWAEVDGFRVWRGHYTYRGKKIVPSWGGSMFEALMVPLFVPEGEWSPHSWGVNHRRHVWSQIEHGLREEDYGYWGFSPANVPAGGYSEYGVDAVGMQTEGYTSKGVVTPHASFLAMPFARGHAVANLLRIERDFGAYHDGLGFRDSVDVRDGTVSGAMLALDQGMIAAALAQVLRPGTLQRPFRRGGFARRVRPLLRREDFGIA
ncbi:glucoamylase family protein [Streptomyces sp. DSM 42041]|uniref:Glucoamylase family protein n=1 Tax=Streptomyces hazeniae TaxID=3075538 RepID=A0ABU2NLU8_9ACTN|nr:glucoamylase family protein [Streptomyces sp. DSM 42041]MDT0377951.1 glucoamylase family protein [Streptomyces sp. DSM 42041]